MYCVSKYIYNFIRIYISVYIYPHLIPTYP